MVSSKHRQKEQAGHDSSRIDKDIQSIRHPNPARQGESEQALVRSAKWNPREQVPQAGSQITDLPCELLTEVVSYLSYTDLVNVTTACKQYASLFEPILQQVFANIPMRIVTYRWERGKLAYEAAILYIGWFPQGVELHTNIKRYPAPTRADMTVMVTHLCYDGHAPTSVGHHTKSTGREYYAPLQHLNLPSLYRVIKRNRAVGYHYKLYRLRAAFILGYILPTHIIISEPQDTGKSYQVSNEPLPEKWAGKVERCSFIPLDIKVGDFGYHANDKLSDLWTGPPQSHTRRWFPEIRPHGCSYYTLPYCPPYSVFADYTSGRLPHVCH